MYTKAMVENEDAKTMLRHHTTEPGASTNWWGFAAYS